MGWTQGACYSKFHPSKCWIFQQVLFIEVLCHTDRLWSSTGMWLQCIWTTWRRTDSHTLCRSISCWGEHIEPLTFQEHNVCHIHPDRSNWTSWFDEFDQFLWSRHHCAVCSQSLKEPAVSLAAGLRHSLAVTGKFAQKNKTMCFHYAVNPQIQISVPPSDSGCVYQWGTGLSSHAKRALSPRPVPSHLSSTVPSLVPGEWEWNSVPTKIKFLGPKWVRTLINDC